MEKQKFYDLFLAGKINEDAIDDYIDEWHENDYQGTIYEYLGMTKEVYFKWVENGYFYKEEE